MLSNEIGWNFDNTYSKLPESFISKISPIPVKSPELTIFNYNLAEKLGLNFSSIEKMIYLNYFREIYCLKDLNL